MKKWGIYALTFLTYSLIHSVRTCWASLKTMLEGEPFLFQEEFLGILDMLVLFTLAIFLNIFGHIVQKYPCRRILFPMLATIVLNMLCLFGGLMGGLRSKLFYLVFYGSFGIVSCLGWPVCLYVLDPPRRPCLSTSTPPTPPPSPSGTPSPSLATQLPL